VKYFNTLRRMQKPVIIESIDRINLSNCSQSRWQRA